MSEDGVALQHLCSSSVSDEGEATKLWVRRPISEALQQSIKHRKHANVASSRMIRPIASRPSVGIRPGECRVVEYLLIAYCREEEGGNADRILVCFGRAGVAGFGPGVVEDLEVDVGVAFDAVDDDEGVASFGFVVAAGDCT